MLALLVAAFPPKMLTGISPYLNTTPMTTVVPLEFIGRVFMYRHMVTVNIGSILK